MWMIGKEGKMTEKRMGKMMGIRKEEKMDGMSIMTVIRFIGMIRNEVSKMRKMIITMSIVNVIKFIWMTRKEVSMMGKLIG